MNKLRLDFLKAQNVKLVKGDVCTSPMLSEAHTIEDEDDAKDWNDDSDINNQCFVVSFAPRKNTGEQPCGDDVPVVCTLRDSTKLRSALGGSIIWEMNALGFNPVRDVVTWKPELDALIKRQDEHDKQGKTVWDAVNHYQSGAVKVGTDGWHVGLMSDNIFYKSELVCTIEEVKQCIKEMGDFAGADAFVEYRFKLTESRAKKPFMQTGEAFEHTKALNFIRDRMINVHGENSHYDYMHKLNNAITYVERGEEPCTMGAIAEPVKPVYTQAMKDAGELPSVGLECFLIPDNTVWGFTSTDKVLGVVECYVDDWLWFREKDSKGTLTRMDKISFEPIDTRTPEQKQVDEISHLLTIQGFAHDPVWIKCLQSNGHLAPIK